MRLRVINSSAAFALLVAGAKLGFATNGEWIHVSYDSCPLGIAAPSGIKKKADGAHHNIGAIKCTDKGDGKIELEWTGTLGKLEVEEIARY